jgi:hypothetical protein
MEKSLTGMGLDYEKRVSEKVARELLTEFIGAQRDLPRMGYELDLRIANAEFGTKARLMLQNISGVFVLASCTDRRESWQEVFGIAG